MSDKISAAEKEAMRELAKERKQQLNRAESLAATMTRIDSMNPEDKALALNVHRIAMSVNPDFLVKTWYGMPAYYVDGKAVVFFQDAGKFESRYCTLGFQDTAKLDEGTFWATSFALTGVTPKVEKEIVTLIKRALGQK
jgi:uncharacterized protein YdhG (YjbR/CyaY superfamily)